MTFKVENCEPQLREEEIHRKVAEAARVAVAQALKEKKVAASTGRRAESKNLVQGNELCG